ncbi:MAG: hypothetical protein V1875_05005 [Candidatus Altiarchaeota archaeon]
MSEQKLTKSKIAILLSLFVMVGAGFVGILLAFFVNKTLGIVAIFFGLFLGVVGIAGGVTLDKVWKK